MYRVEHFLQRTSSTAANQPQCTAVTPAPQETFPNGLYHAKLDRYKPY